MKTQTHAPRILAFDTAGAGCAAAVNRGSGTLARKLEVMRRGQAERLVPMIEAVMAEAGLGYEALDAIAVTTGPGGFTGVRIGLAAARGFALALSRPVIGISNFEAVAAATTADERAGRTLAVVIDAKRSDVYVQAFDDDLAPLDEPFAAPPASLHDRLPAGPLLLAGDGAGQAGPELVSADRDVRVSAAPVQVDAGLVASLAGTRPMPAPEDAPPRPLYLRPPDVTPPPGNGGAAAGTPRGES